MAHATAELYFLCAYILTLATSNRAVALCSGIVTTLLLPALPAAAHSLPTHAAAVYATLAAAVLLAAVWPPSPSDGAAVPPPAARWMRACVYLCALALVIAPRFNYYFTPAIAAATGGSGSGGSGVFDRSHLLVAVLACVCTANARRVRGGWVLIEIAESIVSALLGRKVDAPSPAVINSAAADIPLLDRTAAIAGSSGNRGIFDFTHSLLNVEVDTLWGNLGFWASPSNASDDRKSTADATVSGLAGLGRQFVAANERLASELADRAKLTRNDHVLDIGFGCGDQTLHFMRRYGVRRITGYNPGASKCAIANARVDRFPLAADAKRADIDLRCGSADDFIRAYAGGPTATPVFTKALALDSAYHFPRRADFYRAAFDRLVPGADSKLAITDLLLRDDSAPAPNAGWWPRLRATLFRVAVLPVIARLCSIPPSNLLTIDRYRAELQAIGYERVAIDCVDANVFVPFAEFVTAHRRSMERAIGGAAGAKLWVKFVVTAQLMRWAYERKWFHYCIVTADRP